MVIFFNLLEWSISLRKSSCWGPSPTTLANHSHPGFSGRTSWEGVIWETWGDLSNNVIRMLLFLWRSSCPPLQPASLGHRLNIPLCVTGLWVWRCVRGSRSWPRRKDTATRVCNTQQASSVDLGQGCMRDKVSSSQLETIQRDHHPERKEGKGLLGRGARSEGLRVCPVGHLWVRGPKDCSSLRGSYNHSLFLINGLESWGEVSWGLQSSQVLSG